MITLYSRTDAPVTQAELRQGEKRKATVYFNNVASKLGTSVSSVTWNVEDSSDAVTISGEALSSGIATAFVTANSSYNGCAMVTVKATMADTQTVTEYIQFEVTGEEC